uniref:Uncharacterized protein n=1 Tax=Theileria annulata TaxID=5874 RepID=A0A3B0MPD5_THEAN
MDELLCVWNSIFSESNEYTFGYNEKLYNLLITQEYTNYINSSKNYINSSKNNINPFKDNINPTKDINSFNDIRPYSFKQILQIILNNNDPEINIILNTFFNLREYLINSFNEIMIENGFEELLKDSIKLIIVDAFNRKLKQMNIDFTPILIDVTGVKNIEQYLQIIKEIKLLINQINNINNNINIKQNIINNVIL